MAHIKFQLLHKKHLIQMSWTQIKKHTNTCHLVQKISVNLVSSSNWGAYFSSSDHCSQVSVGFEDNQVTQIIKKLCHKYLTMRHHTCGKL